MARKSKSGNRIVKLLVLVIILAAAGYASYRIYGGMQGDTKAAGVMSSLERIIPGLGVDTGVERGMGRDPLAAISVDDMDIVGVIEIPALDIMAPVTDKGIEEPYFAAWLDGSPVQGNFKIIGGRDDIFRKIASLKPGDKVVFTDIDGVRYNYDVTTQYHLKKWDAGDNDMQLCYETDNDTYFVVGCSSAK